MNHGEPYEAEQERDEAVAQLRDLRRQMEEQRKQGNWPLSKVVAERDRLLRTHVPKSWLEDEQRDHRATKAERDRLRDRLWDLRARAGREPLDTDISDYSDEWCDGFLYGQAHALDAALAGADT